jgi:hypothetical protein
MGWTKHSIRGVLDRDTLVGDLDVDYEGMTA